MAESRISLRYARALFMSSEEAGKTETVQKELLDILMLINSCKEFSKFLNHVTLGLKAQNKILNLIFKSDISGFTMNFLFFLVNRRRLSMLADICSSYDKLYREARNILIANISSAFQLSDKQMEEIKSKMHKRYKKHIECTVKTDPTLLGGFVIHVLDQVYDFSILGKLKNLRRSMRFA